MCHARLQRHAAAQLCRCELMHTVRRQFDIRAGTGAYHAEFQFSLQQCDFTCSHDFSIVPSYLERKLQAIGVRTYASIHTYGAYCTPYRTLRWPRWAHNTNLQNGLLPSALYRSLCSLYSALTPSWQNQVPILVFTLFLLSQSTGAPAPRPSTLRASTDLSAAFFAAQICSDSGHNSPALQRLLPLHWIRTLRVRSSFSLITKLYRGFADRRPPLPPPVVVDLLNLAQLKQFSH
ncbi:hypothetical protein PMIN01_03653 [Paraphaeosphaeria minitans]|uniref:Uncharacterized protein n=1 Tax=Paraphaeosphaeria minitans TaxID=565426 RepID=A0A9P6KTK5_9PLEO|nr:hypothetical protein PMIN01_03653 [Paraphaeosphaeria minitans]